MKNLKKVLALALTFALSLTLFAGAAFTDEDQIGDMYKDDIAMLVQLGVINGYEDNTFRPQSNITRAEYAKMAYTLKYGYDDQGKLFVGQTSQFSDVEGNANIAWAKGYINYCANQQIVGGVGNGKFNPTGNVTVAEAAKMLLVILGANPTTEGYGGSNWIGNVTADAMELGVFDGWVGDPTEPATRELVAKLMRNTIFAPMYLYNPITGIGSQVSALDPSVKNETLGEKTMGLKHVEGIVVSNDRYALETDPNGDEYGTSDGDGSLIKVDPSVQAKGNAQIAYKITDAKSNSQWSNGDIALLPLEDVNMSDDLLGNLVNVYFKADGDVGNYNNVEVIGDILVSAKTVAYDVMSADISIMPNGEGTGNRKIKPYIEFTTEDGETKRVDVRGDYSTAREEVDVDYGLNPVAFYDRMYYTETTASTAAPLDWVPSYANVYDEKGNLTGTDLTQIAKSDMITQMGTNHMQKYRFVSVDGGATYAYILRLSNMEMGRVGTMSDISINIAGAGTFDLETEAVVAEGVSRGNQAVYYAKDGVVYVEPTSIITGKATNLKKVEATINGEVYVADLGTLGANITAWFTSDGRTMSSNNNNTQYTVYKNYVLEIEESAVTGVASDYALITMSSYDRLMTTARARFVFADGTEGVYDIGDLWGSESEDLGHVVKFENNMMFGALVRVDIVNGVANITAEAPVENPDSLYAGDAQITGGALKINDKTYHDGGNSIVFLVYGGKESTSGYESIKAKPYRLNGLGDKTAFAPLPNVSSADPEYPREDVYVANAVGSKGSAGYTTLVAGAFSVGGDLIYQNELTQDIAYIVNAEAQYNSDTDKYYFDITMITKDGPMETRTVDDVRKDSGQKWSDVIDASDIGVGGKYSEIPTGSVVVYGLTPSPIEGDTTEWIETIGFNTSDVGSAEIGNPENMIKNPLDASGNLKDGYWMVTIGVVRNDLIGFWKYGTPMGENDEWEVDYTAKIDDKVYNVIAIDNNNWVEGGDVETVSKGDTWGETDYNAIIVVEGGKITNVISLYGNIN